MKAQLPSFLTTISVPLPSKGIIYEIGSPLHKRENVEIREMTANEEDLLTSLSLIRTGKAIDEVVKACLMSEDVKPDKLLVGDRNSIIIGLILASYGSKYNTDVKCESCSEINKGYSFEVNDLPVKWINAEPISEGINEFRFELPKSKKIITFALTTVETDREITTQIKKFQSISNRETNVTSRLKNLILSIDGDRDKAKIAEFIEARQMPITDSLALRDYMEQISPDIDTRQDFTCQSCGHQTQITMPIDFNFFWRTAR